MTLALENRGATFSDDRRYRYALWRIWNDALPWVVFILLNPSTADESVDDPTIRKCMGFARAWGYGGVYILNLFALRATDPRELKRVYESQVGQAAYYAVVGQENNHYLWEYAHAESSLVVAGWGEYGAFLNRGQRVQELLPDGLMCLGVNKSGQPKHPLYVPAKTKPYRAKEQEREYGDYGPGRYAWILSNIEQLEPIPCKGALGLWEYTP